MRCSVAKGVFLFLCCATAFKLEALPGYNAPWGKDADLLPVPRDEVPPLPERRGPLLKIAEGIIWFHTHIISPADGPRSHFRPTSSRYMLLAMKRHGFIKGYIMGCNRLLRENKDPWVYRKRVIDGVEFKWDPTY